MEGGLLKENLKRVGLSRVEIEVYLALLSGALSAQELTRAVNFPRSTVILALQELLNRNVITFYAKGKRKIFYIEKPENLLNFVISEEEEINLKKLIGKSIVPQLNNLHFLKHLGGKIHVDFFEGEDGLKKLYLKTLDQKGGGEILRFGIQTEKFTVSEAFTKFRREYVKMKIKKRIRTRLLIPESPLAKEVKKDDKNDLRETRFLTKTLYNPTSQVAVWDNKISFVVWDRKLTAVLIENTSFAEIMRMIFEISWKSARK